MWLAVNSSHSPPLQRIYFQAGLRAYKWREPVISPSHANAQWHMDITLLTYRCGGSVGLGVYRTNFPFNQSRVHSTGTSKQSITITIIFL